MSAVGVKQIPVLCCTRFCLLTTTHDADTVNLVLDFNEGHEVIRAIVSRVFNGSVSPGFPRHVFSWYLGMTGRGVRTDLIKNPGPRNATHTMCYGTSSQTTTIILAKSRELLHPLIPPIPELEYVPDKTQVVVVGAGLTGLHVAQQFALAGV